LDHHHVVVVVVAGDSYIEFPISIDLNDMGCNIRGIGWYKCNLLDCWRVVVFVILDCFVLADNNYNGGLFLRSVVWVRLKCLWWIGDIEKVWEEEDKKKERKKETLVLFEAHWVLPMIIRKYLRIYLIWLILSTRNADYNLFLIKFEIAFLAIFEHLQNLWKNDWKKWGKNEEKMRKKWEENEKKMRKNGKNEKKVKKTSRKMTIISLATPHPLPLKPQNTHNPPKPLKPFKALKITLKIIKTLNSCPK